MSTEVPKDDLPTSALFEVTPGGYNALLEGSRHVYAMPPATEPYLTKCGVVTDVPVRT
jgi:hypothetical protein